MDSPRNDQTFSASSAILVSCDTHRLSMTPESSPATNFDSPDATCRRVSQLSYDEINENRQQLEDAENQELGKSLQELLPHHVDNDCNFTINWAGVVDRLRSHPHEAAIPYYGSNGDFPDAACHSPYQHSGKRLEHYHALHILVRWNPPLLALAECLKAFPGAVLLETDEGSPLQMAAESNSCCESVLRLLLWTHLEVLGRREFTREGACSNANPIYWIASPDVDSRISHLLLSYYPYGAVQSSEDGLFPSPLSELLDELEDLDSIDDDDNQSSQRHLKSFDVYRECPCEEGISEFQANGFVPIDDASIISSIVDDVSFSFSPSSWNERSDDHGCDFVEDDIVSVYSSSGHSLSSTPLSMATVNQQWEKLIFMLNAAESYVMTGVKCRRPDDYQSSSYDHSPCIGPYYGASLLGLNSFTACAKNFHPVHTLLRCATDQANFDLHLCGPNRLVAVLRQMKHNMPQEFSKTDQRGLLPLHSWLEERYSHVPKRKDNKVRNDQYQQAGSHTRADEGKDNDCTNRTTALRVEELVAILRLLLAAMPTSALETPYPSAFGSRLPGSNSGRLPLHVAIENQWPIAFCQILLDAAPHTAATRDINTRLLPFQLVAASNLIPEHKPNVTVATPPNLMQNSPLDLSFQLLLSDPSVILNTADASRVPRRKRTLHLSQFETDPHENKSAISSKKRKLDPLAVCEKNSLLTIDFESSK